MAAQNLYCDITSLVAVLPGLEFRIKYENLFLLSETVN